MTNVEPRTVSLQWDDTLAHQFGGRDPRLLVDVMSTMGEAEEKDYFISGFSATYAGDSSSERMAVLVADVPCSEATFCAERGDRAVVACAPLEGGLANWHIGAARRGERLGAYGPQRQVAVAIPLGAAGLRLWVGRLQFARGFDPVDGRLLPSISRVPGKGLLPTGEAVVTDPARPFRGVPRADLLRLCPDIVVVEPPELTSWSASPRPRRGRWHKKH